MEGRYVPSLLAAIGGVIEKHMLATGFLKSAQNLSGTDPADVDADRVAVGETPRGSGGQCPKCGDFAMVFQEGCATCMSCGYSKCG